MSSINVLQELIRNSQADATLVKDSSYTGSPDLQFVDDTYLVSGEVTFDLGTVNADADATDDGTLTGAAVGDIVLWGYVSSTGDIDECQVTAYVSAADTVTVNVKNNGADNDDLSDLKLNLIAITPSS